MAFDFGKAEVPVRCPQCSREFKKPLRRFEKKETVSCPGCGNQIALSLSNPGEVRKIDTAVTDFTKSLRDFGKRR